MSIGICMREYEDFFLEEYAIAGGEDTKSKYVDTAFQVSGIFPS